jgi:hypothetical protein
LVTNGSLLARRLPTMLDRYDESVSDLLEVLEG